MLGETVRHHAARIDELSAKLQEADRMMRGAAQDGAGAQAILLQAQLEARQRLEELDACHGILKSALAPLPEDIKRAATTTTTKTTTTSSGADSTTVYELSSGALTAGRSAAWACSAATFRWSSTAGTPRCSSPAPPPPRAGPPAARGDAAAPPRARSRT